MDGFERLFKLHIQKKKVVFDSEADTFENHFGCCTFNTQRKNERQGLERIQLSFAQKNRWDDDWLNYWFYVKVEMKNNGDRQLVYPFHMTIRTMGVATTPPVVRSKMVKKYESAFTPMELRAPCLGGTW